MKFGVGGRTGVYDSVVGAVLFGAGVAVAWALGASPVAGVAGAVVAALLNVAIRSAVPSPETRASRAEIARLDAKATQLANKLATHTPENFARKMNRRRGAGVKPFGSGDSFIGGGFT